VVQLHRDRKEFEAAGVRLVLIGQATPRHAAHFRRKLGIDLPVLADEERDSYGAAGAKIATFGELLGPSSLAKGVRASARSRVIQGRTIGNNAQLGGVLIVKPDGTVAHAHMSEDAADNVPGAELLAAARSVTAA